MDWKCLTKIPESSQNQTLNLHEQSTIYIAFTLYSQWFTYHLRCIKYSDQFSHSVLSNSFRPHGQCVRPPCPSPTPRAYSDSCPLSQWSHATISSFVVPFSSHLPSFPTSGCFQTSQFLASGGQNIGVLAWASVLPMNIQEWFLLGWTGWISFLSKGLSRVFSNTIVQSHQFFGTQLSL